ncbi:hypothetical protein PIB30_086041 [Stylosanthes scabra]|uniref:Uncharacterized protein n=1 Tax=Stylosanthes scabra TaxID=79078 RepID=A0ABU6TSL5_9FABA|nr:hypothetical protein [Stylosanthes scabra]
MASSTSVSVFDNYCFKTAFNEELYNFIVKNKKVIAECCIDLDEDEYPEVKEQISLRGWRRLAAPKQEIMSGGEDVRAEDIIADKIVRMAQGIKEKGKLGFPSTIYKLCKEAGVPLREFRRTKKIQAEKPITAKRMESTRLRRPVQRRQQEDEEEDEPMPQAEEGNEGQAHDYDYHHQPEYEHQQPDYEQPQPDFEHHQEFNEPPVQPPLYHVPTYIDQHQKDLASIEEQLQNMMWYQQQALENMSKNQVNQYNMIRQDQKLLGKEILDVKKYQMSAVTMGSDGSSSSTQPPPPPPYEPDQALMKISEQHATFIEICRQLKDWTGNASGRESYMVWAHQLANPNLVEMSSQKIVKQIYDNIDRKRPMFRGLFEV